MKLRKLLAASAALAALLIVALTVSVSVSADEIEIGAKAPDFTAIGTDGKTYNLASSGDAKAVVLCFTCNGCPVARAYEERLIDFVKQYEGKPVMMIALNCNNKTEDLEAMKAHAKEAGFNFVYAFDESGEAARAYGARVTPHLFVLDADRKVAYRGSFDDSQRDPETAYVAAAVDAILAGRAPETTSTKAFGCGIKLKKLATN